MTRLFAALGSDTNMPDVDGGLAGRQIATLHIASSDGIFSWTDAVLAESGVNTLVSGSRNSIRLADMNGDGNVNGLDVTPFVQVVANLALYQAAFPGLDGVGRGNINGDADANGLDVTPFVTCVTMVGCPGSGGGSGGGGGVAASAVPEPGSILLALIGAAALGFVRRGRR
jgi:hypothetical protein